MKIVFLVDLVEWMDCSKIVAVELISVMLGVIVRV